MKINKMKILGLLLIGINIILLILNENVILFISYILLFLLLIVIIQTLKNRFFENINIKDIENEENLMNYIKIKYSLLLFLKYNLIKMMKLYIYLIKKETFIFEKNIIDSVKKNIIDFNINMKMKLFMKLNNLVVFKRENLERIKENSEKNMKLYSIFKNNNIIFKS